MALEVYYPTDVENAIQAARQAHLATADAGEIPPEYRQGFIDALDVIAVAFGLARREQARWPSYALALGRG